VGSALGKRSRLDQASGGGQATPGAELPAAPGAAGAATVRPDPTAWQILIAAAGLLAGIGVAWVVSTGGPDRPGVPHLPLAVPVVVLVGWSFIGGGLLYWRSRPANHLWAVLVFQGFAWFASMLPLVTCPTGAA
jgi:hypothetical protein